MTRLIMASALLLVQLWMTTFTHANVVLSGTRVIFPADAKDQSLQFQNKSNTPFLVQIWLDAGNPDSTPENQDAPFVVKPQVFRLNSIRDKQHVFFIVVMDNFPKIVNLFFI